ncbi:MAG: leucine-rich repeat domain-containing protein [Bacteroidales bacterium]|nr:leucine-rich repeat domain-containing protein [Bacteroidales bacterium]
MKKLFSFLTMIVLATSAKAYPYHFSAVCETGQTLYYYILPNDNQEVKVTFPYNNTTDPYYGYTKPEGDLIIPETIEYEGITYTVVSIGFNAFFACDGITSVELPNTIQRIEAEAFMDCIGLSSSFVIPDQCTFIGGYAFTDCTALSSLTIGASVDTIQYSAFEDCIGLQSIHCKTPAPPFAEHIPSNPYYEDRSIFNNVPTDIPVYVNCLTFDQFLLNWDWSRFVNMEGVFLGPPTLTVGTNNPEYGTAEVVSIPEDCDHLTATVRAIPNLGHVFGYWKRNGVIVSFVPEYTFTLDHNCVMTACFDCSATVYDSIGYPGHVIGRSYDNSGQVTHEYPSEFIYDQDGKLTNFSFPSHLYTTFNFFEYPTMPNSILTEYGGHPYTYDRYDYVYVSNHLIHSSAYNSLDDIWAYFDYYYDANWHMTKKEKTVTDYYYNVLNTYQYEDNFRTVIDSCFYGYESLPLRTITTSHYDERQRILNAYTDTFNDNGEITSSLLQTYVYTPNNKTDSIISQTLTDGEWVNTSYTHYVYDNMKRVVEYQTGLWSAEEACWNISKKTTYDFDDEEQKLIVSFFKMNGDEWERDCFTDQTIFYDPELIEWQKAISYYNNYYLQTNQLEINLHYVTVETSFPRQSEWYYEIEWENGDITYQHLEYAADTTIGTERPKIIVRTNTIYDRDEHTEVTHEYILERDGKVYWWNKELEEFTTLYDYNAEAGDEWEIKVGTESILVHVDSVGVFEYEGDIRKMLHISDAGNIFNGDIVVGYGHMTSFFPEKLMRRDGDFTINGLRCYWVQDALLYHNGDDCDAIYSENHGVDEDGPSTGSGTFTVYPNPTDGVLTVSVRLPQCDSPTTGQTAYRITNQMGQTLLTGNISAETQQIDITNLPAGMYFISMGGQTVKFVVK